MRKLNLNEIQKIAGGKNHNNDVMCIFNIYNLENDKMTNVTISKTEGHPLDHKGSMKNICRLFYDTSHSVSEKDQVIKKIDPNGYYSENELFLKNHRYINYP